MKVDRAKVDREKCLKQKFYIYDLTMDCRSIAQSWQHIFWLGKLRVHVCLEEGERKKTSWQKMGVTPKYTKSNFFCCCSFGLKTKRKRCKLSNGQVEKKPIVFMYNWSSILVWEISLSICDYDVKRSSAIRILHEFYLIKCRITLVYNQSTTLKIWWKLPFSLQGVGKAEQT